MNGNKTSMPIALFLVVALTTLTIVLTQRSADAQDVAGLKWCNAYVDQGLSLGKLAASNRQSEGERLLKIKFGKSLDVEKNSALAKMKWWADFVIAPDEARDKRFMYFYPVSAIDGQTMSEIVRSISEASGNEKPLFAMATTRDVLKKVGIDFAVASKSELVAAPVWWNRDIADTMRDAIFGYSGDSSDVNDRLAQLVGLTVASSAVYDSVSVSCGPNWASSANLAALTAYPDLEHATYFGVSTPINSLRADMTPAIVMKRAWPVID